MPSDTVEEIGIMATESVCANWFCMVLLMLLATHGPGNVVDRPLRYFWGHAGLSEREFPLRSVVGPATAIMAADRVRAGFVWLELHPQNSG